MSVISALFNLPIRADFCFTDGFGGQFLFRPFVLDAKPDYSRVVYAFATPEQRVLYFGRAEDLPQRLYGHERKDEAAAFGATELWVHQPAPNAPLNYIAAEQHLIRACAPMMNDQHNIVRALLGY